MNRKNAAVGAVNGKKHSNKTHVLEAAAGRKDGEGRIPRPVSKNILTKSMKMLGSKKVLACRTNGVTEVVPSVSEARPVAIVKPHVVELVGTEESDRASADGPYFDVDIADHSNPQLCAEYVKEIYQ